MRLGVAGAVLAFLALTGVQAVALRPYLPPDELYHVGYAAWLLEGRLPTLTSPLPRERVPMPPGDGLPRRVYVANHPPLFHALAAVPIGLGERLGAPRAGFLAARLLSAALAGAGVALVGWLALLVVPGRPRVALARAPGLVLVGFAGAAAAAGVLLHGRRSGARRLLAAAAGGVVAGLAGGSARWFYLRNRSLYGSLTGTAYNQDLFGFVPQDHALDLLTSPAYALRLYDGLWVWTRFSLPRVPTLPALVAVPRVVGLLVLAGLALTAIRRLRLRPPGGPVAGMQPAPAAAGRLGRGGRSQRLDRPALCAWGLLLAWPVAVFAMVATYDGNGGHAHPRYLFPGLAVLAVVAALGLDGLPGGRLGLWTAAVILAQLALTGAAWAGFLTALRGRRPTGPVDLAGAVARLLEAGGARPAWLPLGLAAAALLTAAALLVLALARCRDGAAAPAAAADTAAAGADPGDPAPAPPGDPGGVPRTSAPPLSSRT